MSDSETAFEVLLKTILSPGNLSEKEQFIRKNSSKIICLVKWLCKTVLTIVNDCNSTDNSKYDKCPRVTAEETEPEAIESNKLLTFALDGILIISSIANGETFDEKICQAVAEETEFLNFLNDQILLPCKDESDVYLDRYLGILVNFTRQESFVNQMVENTHSSKLKDFLPKLIDKIEKEKQEQRQHLLVAYLNNLCQSEIVRSYLVNQKILLELFDIYENSKTDFELRRLIIELIRNCCLDFTQHRNMITEKDVEFLIRLVLPLTGGEELDSQETDSLPLDLQYLPVDKERESDPVVRRSLIEAIHQLCSTRYGREIIRQTNIYYLLREYHKWEKIPELIEALLKVVDIIIRTEDEIQVDNLKDLELPPELVEKFQEIDKELAKEQ